MDFVLMLSTTLDGRIARSRDERITWTSKEDKKNFMAKTKEAGVVIVGKTTFDTFPAPLPGRLHLVVSNTPQISNNGQVVYVDGDIKQMIHLLKNKGYTKAYVIGGQSIYSLFIREHYATELDITFEPKLFGTGMTFIEDIGEMVQAELIETTCLNQNTINCRYHFIYS